MRLTLDTDKKTISFSENTSLTELFILIGKILPSKEWKDYTLIAPKPIIVFEKSIVGQSRSPQPTAQPDYYNPGTGGSHSWAHTTGTNDHGVFFAGRE